MIEIKKLSDITSMVPRVRIVSSTHSPVISTRRMIGGEFNLDRVDYRTKVVKVADWDFSLCDIQFLTPLKFKGETIGIGDRLIGDEGDHYEVYGFHFYDGEFILDTNQNGEYVGCNSYSYDQDEINHEFENLEKLRTVSSDDIEKAIKLLEKVGKIKGGKIITD